MSFQARKRHSLQEEDGHIVDDLVIVAQHALAKPPISGSNEATQQHDDNEISLQSSDDSVMEEKNVDNIENIDDESDVDLNEELANMQEESDLGAECPKTIHEMDAYATDFKRIEAAFNINLTVEEQEQQRLQSMATKISPAGTVQHHMIEERTIVIKSKQGVLLEEGNLLIIKSDQFGLIPLGKIFEVFGPVSQPMYSIRLAEPLETGDENATKDPWTADGVYTTLLQDQPSIPVFFVEDQAKWIDPTEVYRNSARGCDASNMHDEEVINPAEMYYSDDEEEREAKGMMKPKSSRSQSDTLNVRQETPYGFHNAQANPVQRHQETKVESLIQYPPPKQDNDEGDTEYFFDYP